MKLKEFARRVQELIDDGKGEYEVVMVSNPNPLVRADIFPKKYYHNSMPSGKLVPKKSVFIDEEDV